MEHEDDHVVSPTAIPLPSLQATQAQITAFVRSVMAQAENHAHSDDPGMAREHEAVLDLVPRSEATHVAIASGDWFDPDTWYQGRIPGEGAKVLIPEAATVTYDGRSDASLFTIRVDGELKFATDANTKMVVDTMVVAPSGKLEIGSEHDPIAANVKAEIVIANNGNIDTSWDPLLFSRGIVSHGAVEIHGAEKTSFLKVDDAPMAGDRTITLSEAPDGWRVGDTIVLTGTHKTGWSWSDSARRVVHQESQDEEVQITAINGNRITLNRALTYDHDTPRADLHAYVSNMTRNVTIHSEDGESTPVQQRGHVMLMHSDDIDVRYAAFDDLGRTDKSRPAWDASALDTVTAISNVKGRYALHLHKTGLDDQDNPAMVVGNAVSGSPGWGFAHHSSNAVFADNAAFDIFGAAYAAEDGDETGAWIHNIAIKTEGIGYGGATVKQESDLPRHDNGRTGDGFFFAGRLVEARDNVAANTTHGYVWMHRSAPKDPGADTVDHPEIAYGADKVRLDQAPIQGFHDNEAFGTQAGFIVVRADSRQGHDVRTILDGFLNWETSLGMDVTYTSHYTIKNIDLIGTTNRQAVANAELGFRFEGNAFDVVVNGMKIDGFPVGVDFSDNVFTFPVVNGDVGHVLIDVEMGDVGAQYRGYNSARHRIMSSDDLVPGRLNFTPSGDRTLSWNETLYFNGTKTDSIGSRNRQFVSVDDLQGGTFYEHFVPMLQDQGYHVTADGRKVLLVDDFVADRATGELLKFSTIITLDMSNAQLASIGATNHGSITLGGQAPVAGADRANTTVDTPLLINVLANDRDPEGGAIRVDGLLQPEHGRVLQSEDGRAVLYIPDLDFSGTDTFQYWVGDVSGNFTKGTVTVTVEGEVEHPHVPTGVTLQGANGIDRLYGGESDDALYGGRNADRLYGAAGNDRLFGETGDDRLYGGRGADILTGGQGADRFIFDAGDGADTIVDFNPDTDFLAFRDGIDSRADVTFTRQGSDTLIRYSGGTILVHDTVPADFTADHLLF